MNFKAIFQNEILRSRALYKLEIAEAAVIRGRPCLLHSSLAIP